MFEKEKKSMKVKAVCNHYGIDEKDALAIRALHLDTDGGKLGPNLYDKNSEHVIGTVKIVLGNNKAVTAYQRLINDPAYREEMFRIYNETVVPAMQRLSNVSIFEVARQALKHGRIIDLDR